VTSVERTFHAIAPRVDRWSIRHVVTRGEELSVVRGIVQPVRSAHDEGAMVTVADGGGVGYAATTDLGAGGLRLAAERAVDWARRSASRMVFDPRRLRRDARSGEFRSPVSVPWHSVPLADKIGLLRRQNERLHRHPRIGDWSASLWYSETESTLLTSDGARIEQLFACVLPTMNATASDGEESETRTFGGHAWSRQGGFEVVADLGFEEAAERTADEALELLAAPQCPAGTMDCLLAPDQMILQVHESIGHPLELDRILGDERNYAGRSFVTLDLFGTYPYGSELLNVTFDPTVAGEFAAFAFDDEGTEARREFLIRDGILLRPIGGSVSQQRTGLPGVACARASGWNRPPIDRMANVNLEPGTSSFASMVARVERGVYMETNCSWSIDDSRNKFQFGCELGRRIVDGKLGDVVRKPNYRGTTREFWHRLVGVGDRDTFRILGTPYCGKGEPNQAIRAGHAAPACLFRGVEVFGGVS
jgi:predicted Zn-dependent protease